eukprot:1056970-Pyramimonas_sp.AAC.1
MVRGPQRANAVLVPDHEALPPPARGSCRDPVRDFGHSVDVELCAPETARLPQRQVLGGKFHPACRVSRSRVRSLLSFDGPRHACFYDAAAPLVREAHGVLAHWRSANAPLGTKRARPQLSSPWPPVPS